MTSERSSSNASNRGKALHAQTTASLTGTVTVEGQPLAGATVTATSPSLQGTRTAMSAEDGTYRFEALPPGEYKLDFHHRATDIEQRTVRLELSRTARVDVELRLGLIDNIVSPAPLPTAIEVPEVSANLQLREVER